MPITSVSTQRRNNQLSLHTLRVLRALLDNNCSAKYGFDLTKRLGMLAGTLYPMLHRLEENKWVTRELESIDPAAAGRPARFYYTLTAEGRQAARQILTELSEMLRPPMEGR